MIPYFLTCHTNMKMSGLSKVEMSGIDKYKAAHRKFHVSNQRIAIFTILGGNVGALIAMDRFHYKTIKEILLRTFWLITAIELLLIICYVLE